MSEPAWNLASRWRRLAGALIDGAIISIILGLIYWGTGWGIDALQRTFSGQAMALREQVIFFIVTWGVFVILHGNLLLNRGQTIGKVAMNTKIVDMSGNIPNFGKLLVLRYLVLGLVAHNPTFGLLMALVNPLFIFGEARRCLHDYLAGTRVIEA